MQDTYIIIRCIERTEEVRVLRRPHSATAQFISHSNHAAASTTHIHTYVLYMTARSNLQHNISNHGSLQSLLRVSISRTGSVMLLGKWVAWRWDVAILFLSFVFFFHCRLVMPRRSTWRSNRCRWRFAVWSTKGIYGVLRLYLMLQSSPRICHDLM